MIDEKKKTAKAAILAVITFSISLALFLSGALKGFELKAYDLFSRLLNPAQSPEDIIIIKIDQPSIDALSQQGINWPWPRQIYAPLVEYLSEADAVFMDILFTEPSSYGEEDDTIFATAVKKAANVYLPVFLTNNLRQMSREDMDFIEKIAVKENIPAPVTYEYAITPIDPLKSAVKGAGNPTISPDEDGVYRKVPLFFKMGKYTIPNFTLACLLQKDITIRNGELYSGDAQVPLSDGRLLLRFIPKKEPFETISAVTVLTASVESSASQKPLIDKEYFKGKKVFVGLTAAGLYDLKPTSVSSISTGVSIHAVTLDNLLRKNFLHPVNKAVLTFFMALICVIVSFSVLRFHSLSANLSLFLALLAMAVGIPALLFKLSYYLGIIFPAFSLVTCFLITAAYSYATEGKERRFVRRAFSQYMDETIVDYILKNPSLITPGGTRRHVTVFFTDIAGFTTIAEKMPVEETAKILHTILNEFTEVIIRNRGVIDKYIGDAIMAFWGAPLDTENDEINACRAALQCMDSLTSINESFQKEGLSPISMRIGIHSGDAIVGNLGSDRLFNYTVVGDTVNLASRLEGVNKVFRTKIIISEETWKKTGDTFLTRELGKIEVKGKKQPVIIYELIAEKGKADETKADATDRFRQGLSLFYGKRFREAADVFGAIIEKHPDDGPSLFYSTWCEQLMDASSLTEDWDIIKMTVK